jgi:hypothetical protein
MGGILKQSKQSFMNILKKTMILGGCVAALGLGLSAQAQPGGGGGFGGGGPGGGGGFGGGGPGGGGFQQFQQQQQDAYRKALGVTDDSEWTAISAKITALQAANPRGFGGRGGRGGPGGGGGFGGPGGGGGPGGPGGFGGAATPTDAEAALQKAIDDKAPAAEIKTKIAAVHAERQKKAADAAAALKKAQDDLRSVLSARQEAILMLPVPNPNEDTNQFIPSYPAILTE